MANRNPAPQRRRREERLEGVLSSVPLHVSQETTQQPIQEPAKSNAELQQILARLNQLEQENQALKKSVGQQEFERNFAQQNVDKRPTIKLMWIPDERNNPRVIMSWERMITDDVYVDGGKIHETQRVRVTFFDGKTEEMSYHTAFNHQNRTKNLPVNAITTRQGKRWYVVELDGKEVEVEETFIN